MVAILNEGDLNQAFDQIMEKVLLKSEDFQEKDSGWALARIICLEININKYQPIRGSSFIYLPLKIKRKNACINVKNSDEFCFKWALISALKPTNYQSDKSSSYNIENIEDDEIFLRNGRVNSLKFEGLDFPIQVKDISIFEELNPEISVNVFGLIMSASDYELIGPYYLTKSEKQHHINMLLLEKDESFHFIYIHNISRLLRSSLTLHNGNIYLCNSCLQHFSNIETYNIHKDECGKIVTEMVSEDNKILKFKNYHQQMETPFVIYADSESILRSISTCLPNSERSSTTNVKEHIPVAFGYYISCSFDDTLNKYVECVGENCAEEFIVSLTEDCIQLYKKYFLQYQPMKPLTLDEELKHLTDENCHICGKSLDFNNRVRDHCHFTGNYRRPAHYECNLLYKKLSFFPIFSHNFSGYDCHMFFKALNVIHGNINVIPLNKEKYISLSKRICIPEENINFSLRFLDSFRFMASSLDSLFQILDNSKKINIKKAFGFNSDLITKKGIFPYEYLDKWEKLNHSLPDQDKFYNKLTETNCSDDDYRHAKLVWQTFECKNMLDYLKIYLKSDVLILADVFESFRKLCRNIYNLDPANFYIAPGLAWQAMLKFTKIELELFSDINMYNFIKKGMRGGISQCSLRYSKANNKYMGDNFEINQPSKFIIYLDAVNLYGWEMCNYLPYKNFEWCNEPVDVMQISNTNEIGYILEVDLEYPESLHNSHNCLPFCPENKIPPNGKYKKLLTTFYIKNKYIIHYRNLKQCLQNGLILKKIHRVLKFSQSDWLKKYIDLNNNYRMNAKNNFEKMFFKGQNNIIYGKTMEDVEKRRDIKIATK